MWRSVPAACLFACLTTGALPVPVAAQRLAHHVIYDSTYRRPRQLWLYTPPDYDSTGSRYPLIIAFDGADYRDTIPLPRILDTLYAGHHAPAFVAVLVDDSSGAARIAELGNARGMVTFLGRQLVPWVRRQRHVTTDPHRVILTGSSAGGLAAAFAALARPDLFGNVLSQSGAFWRGPEASNEAPYEWLATHVTAIPRQDLRFFLDVGELEDHATLGGAGPNFLGATRRFREALRARGYPVDYTEVPGGQHAPMFWQSRLPIGIVALAASWR